MKKVHQKGTSWWALWPISTAWHRLTFNLVSHTLNNLILPILLNKWGPDGKTRVSNSAVVYLQSSHKVENTLECRLVKYTLKIKDLIGDLKPFKPLLCAVTWSSSMSFNIVPGNKCLKRSIQTWSGFKFTAQNYLKTDCRGFTWRWWMSE